ncbi:hypothetical protein CSKR_107358 [Clonorchis sinensis]|uniref:Uncharacterized protein n=1 Tax=Clonorchis sinensis TaxID=79923 RepID=A0A419PVF8_CLOSI|nr:hypothetical protein CSKR_107358 [Clonorchis sinensis]
MTCTHMHKIKIAQTSAVFKGLFSQDRGFRPSFPGRFCSCRSARWLKWLEREFTDRKVRGSNPISASRLPLSRLGQPGSIPALVLPSGSMAARHRRGVAAERLFVVQRLSLT